MKCWEINGLKHASLLTSLFSNDSDRTCVDSRLDQLTRMCSKHSLTDLCCEDFVYLPLHAFLFFSCSITKKSKQRQETREEAEMSVTALRRQQLLWRKHAGEPLCQHVGQATGDVSFQKKMTLTAQEASSGGVVKMSESL